MRTNSQNLDEGLLKDEDTLARRDLVDEWFDLMDQIAADCEKRGDICGKKTKR